MQYLLMCCINEAQWISTPEAQRDEVMRKYHDLIGDLVASGRYISGAKLGPTSAATMVRQRNGKVAITDGPFAETKEQLGGYHVVECHDLDEAIAIAQRIPTLPVGGAVEVRPVEAMTQ
jgi:hypothetical protein